MKIFLNLKQILWKNLVWNCTTRLYLAWKHGGSKWVGFYAPKKPNTEKQLKKLTTHLENEIKKMGFNRLNIN